MLPTGSKSGCLNHLENIGPVTQLYKNCSTFLYTQYIVAGPVAAWFKARACGLSLARIAGSNPSGCMDVHKRFMLSRRGPCVGLFPRPEAFFRVWCV